MKIALGTKHKKETVIAPVFRSLLDAELLLAEIDTDSFGTFSGEVERIQSPKDTVIAKAIAAAKAANTNFGLASEGSIGVHTQFFPFTNSDHELLAFIDLERNVQIIESHVSADIVAVQAAVDENLDLEKFIQAADLPNHAVLLRDNGPKVTWVRKGLRTKSEIQSAIEEFSSRIEPGKLLLESDFRAMCSPSRQKNIAICAEKLASRLASKCPSCSYLGWGIVGYETGLPCEVCGEVSPHAIRADRYGCLACRHEILVERPDKSIGPARCNMCNP